MNYFNEIENNNYLSTLVKDDNKFINARYIINNVNIKNFEKIFINHITNHNKKFDFYYINCEFQLETNDRLLIQYLIYVTCHINIVYQIRCHSSRDV